MRAKINPKLLQRILYVVVVVGLVVGGYFSRHLWLPKLFPQDATVQSDQPESPPVEEVKVLKLSPQARANLGFSSQPVKVQSYWRKVQIPGVIVDRPGVTERGVTAPIDGVVTKVHAFEGSVIQPGEKLFTLRLASESLQDSQAELFKAIRETEILNKENDRIRELVESGVIPEKRVRELKQQVSRQDALIEAHRQDLISHGLSQTQISQIESGQFLSTIDVHAPTFEQDSEFQPVGFSNQSNSADANFFEIRELKVELGRQVSTGEALAVLANHNSLYIKGHAFKKESSSLARAAENGWEVNVEFSEDSADDWPELEQTFQIRHLSNTTDPSSRTFDFFVPLANQSRVYEKDSQPFIVWRFRPGQRVRIQVPIEEMKDVIVLPAAAIVREGPEAFVFQQNGDLCNRISVQVIHEDRANVVIANDGSLTPGFYIGQCSAASLNRVLKAQAASGMRADVHVHADGTTHAAH